MAGLTDEPNPVRDVDSLLINQEHNKTEDNNNNNSTHLKDNSAVLGRDKEDTSKNLPQGEKDMASIHRSGSRPQLDLSKAAIQGNFEEKDPTILLPNQSDDISHLALDIGGIFFFTLGLFFFALFF